MLTIKDLSVSVGDKKILNEFNLEIKENEVHAIMGPNGVGKSTLSKVILRDDTYKIDNGEITFNDNDILGLKTNEVANLGIFLAMQYPISIDGVSNADMLRTSLTLKNDKPINLFRFVNELEKEYENLSLDKKLVHSSINEGLSGGERKKNEIIGMKILQPKLIILDEIDSGVDVDNLKIISKEINEYKAKNNASILIITHYPHILEYIHPDYVHIMNDGKIVKTGDYNLSLDILKNGYKTTAMKEKTNNE